MSWRTAMFRKRTAGLPQCPCCRLNLEGHTFLDVGSAILGSTEESMLNDAVRHGQWVEAARFQAANAQANIRVWRAFACEGKRFVFPAVLMLEPWEDDTYGEPIVVSDAQFRRELSGLRPSSRL